jgi:hypothetical protein
MKKIEGTVKGAELATPLSGVKISRRDSQGKILEETTSDKYGQWQIFAFYKRNQLVFSFDGYVTKTFTYGEVPQVIRLLEDKLIGYQLRLWYLPGENVEVFVHSPVSYSATLFRHGLHKDCILELGKMTAHQQWITDNYFVEQGLDWEKSFQYKIPNTAKPGLYSLLLTAEGQEPFAIPMIVSTRARVRGYKTKLLVLASTNTWQSYNIWGGRNRYRSFENDVSPNFMTLPKNPLARLKRAIFNRIPDHVKALLRKVLGMKPVSYEWRFQKLTIRRPFTNCQLEADNCFEPFTNHLAGGEWRLLAWLERENIPYDIISGAELHQTPDILKHYKAIIFSTHCEYWTPEMYEGIKKYHENNQLWLLNISGNTMYREIEFFNDGSTRCVSLSFANSCADETQLLGVRFSMADYSTCAPYKILKPEHWAFKGAPINTECPFFGGISLNQNTVKKYSRYDPGRPGVENGLCGMGASGWETDKLSRTAPKDFQVIAKGTNPRGGADMVVREPHGTRGGVFSASSLVFSGSLSVDLVCSLIVKNVIDRALKDLGRNPKA